MAAGNYIKIQPETIDKYTIVPREVVEDPSLTAEAKGVWLYLFSRPADWTIHRADLLRRFHNLGVKKLWRISRELQLSGYLHVFPWKKIDGKYGGWVWQVGATRHPHWTEAARKKFKTQEA